MNRKQKICLLVGIAAIVVMGLFPPWVLETKERWGKTVKYTLEPGPYSWIGNPPARAAETKREPISNYPKYSSERTYITTICSEARAKFIDLYRLGVQFFIVAVVTAGLIVILKYKSQIEKKSISKRGLFSFTLVSSIASGFIIPATIIFFLIAVEGWDEDMLQIWFAGLLFSAGIWILYSAIRWIIIPISRWAAKSFRDV